jgi:hypothetical protein
LVHVKANTHQHRNLRKPDALKIVAGKREAEMPLLFFLPMIIASGLLPAPRRPQPVREED